MCEGTADNRYIVERFLLQSIVVTMEKNKDIAESSTTDELIDILHQEKLKFSVFKEIVKSSDDC